MNENRQVKDVVEYLKEISEIKDKLPNSTLVFRGQENGRWPLVSSAERRLKRSFSNPVEITEPFLEYHEVLLKRCRLKNYDKREQKNLDDLELLADLQHHGAATCLLDFSRSALVALWFACKRSDANGKVFVVNIADAKIFLEITHTDIEKKSIRDILQFKTRDADQAVELPTLETFPTPPNNPNFWFWAPAHLNERITAQHSLFLFGLLSLGELKSEEIIIDSGNKERILQELEELHDICEESLFPDFFGFAYTQRSEAPYLIPDPARYFRSGIKALQREQFSETILDATKAIQLNRRFVDAYFLRGQAYQKSKNYDLAIVDFTKAIELQPDVFNYTSRSFAYFGKGMYENALQDATTAIQHQPDFAQSYYVRSLANFYMGKYDESITDTAQAIKLDPNYAEAYGVRGFAYYRKGEYAQAINDFTQTIQLNPKYPNSYCYRGFSQMHCQRWQEAGSDLTKALEMGFDIVSSFQRNYNSTGAFEQETGIELPEDVADMLTR